MPNGPSRKKSHNLNLLAPQVLVCDFHVLYVMCSDVPRHSKSQQGRQTIDNLILFELEP